MAGAVVAGAVAAGAVAAADVGAAIAELVATPTSMLAAAAMTWVTAAATGATFATAGTGFSATAGRAGDADAAAWLKPAQVSTTAAVNEISDRKKVLRMSELFQLDRTVPVSPRVK